MKTLKAQIVSLVVDEIVKIVKDEMIRYYEGSGVEPEDEHDLFENIKRELAIQCCSNYGFIFTIYNKEG